MVIAWKDLAVDLRGDLPEDLLSDWRWLVPEELQLRMVSTLGDAFLEDARGAIYWLDTGSAKFERIADSKELFDFLRHQPAMLEKWFVPQLISDLLSAGRTLDAGQCFSYKIPLTLGGKLQPQNFSACAVSAHFRALGQIQLQVKDVPVGTRFTSIELGE